MMNVRQRFARRLDLEFLEQRALLAAVDGPYLVTDEEAVFDTPLVAQPAYLETIIDPVFGSTVERISAASGVPFTLADGSVGSWGPDSRHHYSSEQAFNADQSLLHLEQRNGGTRHLYLDADTYEPVYEGDDGVWHPLLPNIRLKAAGNQLYWLDVTQPDTDGPFHSEIVRSWQLPFTSSGFWGTSWDGRYVAIGNATREGATLAVVLDMDAWPEVRMTHTPVSIDDCDSACLVERPQISASGKYLVVSYDSSLPTSMRVFDVNPTDLSISVRQLTTVDTEFPLCPNASGANGGLYDMNNDHADLALNPYDTEGNWIDDPALWDDVVVGPEACDYRGDVVNGRIIGQVVSASLRDGTIVSLDNEDDVARPHHVAAKNYARPGWVYVTFKSDQVGERFNQEVVAMKLDGSGDVERIVHTHSDHAGCSRCEPQAVASPDGSKILFASPWNLDSNGGTQQNIDAYIAIAPLPRVPVTIHVPADHSTIQAAIDAALDGDTVLVAPGTYLEQLTIAGKSITLASEFLTAGDTAKIAETIIDGSRGDVITVTADAGDATRIIGLTIRNGAKGITSETRVQILNNHLHTMSDAVDFDDGGGVVRGNLIENSSDDLIDLDNDVDILIEDNILRDAGDDGIEIRMQGYSKFPRLEIIIRNNLIERSGEDGIQLIGYPSVSNRRFRIEGNVITDSEDVGLGLMSDGNTTEDFRAASLPDPILVINNTFFNNRYSITGGDNLAAVQNIFVGSTAIALLNVDGNSTVAHNLFWNNAVDAQGSNLFDETNRFVDPRFAAEFELAPGSLAIDAGVRQFEFRGETILDLGPSEFVGTAPDLGARESPLTASFQAWDVRPTESGFTLRLTADLNPAELNLYSSSLDTLRPADLALVGSASGHINGSLIWNESATTLEFLATGGPLPLDQYTLTIASRADGLVRADGAAIDGDGDGTLGGDFVAMFAADAAPSVWLTLPDFERSPNQAVDVPTNDARVGLPLTISNADGVTQAGATIEFDPSLLQITGAIRAGDLPDDWKIDAAEEISPGRWRVEVSGVTALSAGPRDLIFLQAAVPDGLDSGTSQAIRVRDVDINTGAVVGRGDRALQLIGLLGDSTGNGEYSGQDAALIARIAVGLDTGFDAYPTMDPRIIGDVTGNGTLSGLDASIVARKAVGLEQAVIPEIPQTSPLAAPAPLAPIPFAPPLEPSPSVWIIESQVSRLPETTTTLFRAVTTAASGRKTTYDDPNQTVSANQLEHPSDSVARRPTQSSSVSDQLYFLLGDAGWENDGRITSWFGKDRFR